MKAGILGFFLLLLAGVGLAIGFSAFIVNQTHRALVLQFGEPVRDDRSSRAFIGGRPSFRRSSSSTAASSIFRPTSRKSSLPTRSG